MKSIFSKRHCSDAALLRIEYNSRHFWLSHPPTLSHLVSFAFVFFVATYVFRCFLIRKYRRLPAAGRFRRPFSSQETKPGQLNLHCNTLGKRFPRYCWEFEHVQITKARVFRIHLCDQFQVHLWAQWKRLGGGEERQKKNSFSMKSIFS